MTLQTALAALILCSSFRLVLSLDCYEGNQVNMTKNFPIGMGTCKAEKFCMEARSDPRAGHVGVYAGCDFSCKEINGTKANCRECTQDKCNTQFGHALKNTVSDLVCLAYLGSTPMDVRCRKNESCAWRIWKDSNGTDEVFMFQGCSKQCLTTYKGNCTLCNADRCNVVVVPKGWNVTLASDEPELFEIPDDTLSVRAQGSPKFLMLQGDEGAAGSALAASLAAVVLLSTASAVAFHLPAGDTSWACM